MSVTPMRVGVLPRAERIPRAITLHSKATKTHLEIADTLIDGELTRTIDGASTLTMTMHDPRKRLLRQPALVRGPGQLGYVDMQFGGVWWRMVKVEKSGDDVTLTFEDRAVAYLRSHAQPRKATRGKVTRAQFARSLVEEVKEGGGIGWYSPDESVVQPIEKKRQKKKKGDKPDKYAKGVPLNRQDLQIRHADGSLSKATPMQIRICDRMLDVAYSLKAPAKAVLALIEACMIESACSNLAGGDADSRGVLQVRDQTAAGMNINNRDPEQCANAFLTRGFYTDPQLGGGGAIALARRHPNVSAGRIAQATQGSAHPERYDRARVEANEMIATYDPGLVDVNWKPGGGTKGSKTVKEPYQFQRGGTEGERENSWDCLQRLASEVNWRCFVDRDRVTFASDATLMNSQPILLLKESMVSVSSIDFDIDRGKQNLSATVILRSPLQVAWPGAVVELDELGPADGRWLIETIRHPVADARGEITLIAPGEADPEPAPTTKTVTSDGPDSWADPVVPPWTLQDDGKDRPRSVLETPRAIIENEVLPIARKHGMATGINKEAVAAANARHGSTVSGNRSDHQGPGSVAWAVDMSNGSEPTVGMNKLAFELAKKFGMEWVGQGVTSVTKSGFRFQMLYRTYVGGNHYNHVHFGCRKV